MPTCSVHPLPYRANPAEYFAAIRHAPGSVLLDSGRPSAERGRYDLLSAWPLVQLAVLPDESGSDFLQRLRIQLTLLGDAELPTTVQLPFAGGLIGYLSYDFGRHLETLPSHAKDDLQLPDARFGVYDWALVSDHQAGTSQLVFHPSWRRRTPAPDRAVQPADCDIRWRLQPRRTDDPRPQRRSLSTGLRTYPGVYPGG